ncbi:MAG: hypothetical protein ACFE0K_14350 [Alcanivorax sp.]|uniref:hypothetical protein n=1 Tax=Alcanivorax sp. TaxID=1872427 RepID=UPI003DA72745
MIPNDTPLQTAAQYMCCNIYPEQYKTNYVTDISADFNGPETTYILQALSLGLTSICFGLISNFLYDKANIKLSPKDKSIEHLLEEQQRKLDQLNELISSVKSTFKFMKDMKCEITQEDRDLARFHEEALFRIKENSPEIKKMIEDSIRELEKRGVDSLSRELDQYHD